MKNISILFIGIILISAPITKLMAQINPLKSQFFENSFLFNSAKAGSDSTSIFSANFNSQWNKLPGSPQIYTVTVNTPINKRMGLGLLLFNDKAGLLSRTSVIGSYSYLVPFTNDISIRFGISAGYLSEDLIYDESITPNKTIDPSLLTFGDSHQDILRAGFGTTFTFKSFEIQASLYNLNRNLRKTNGLKSVDRAGITLLANYVIENKENFTFNILGGYRQINGLSDYFDAGLKIAYNKSIDFSVLYHTNRSTTLGFGYDYRRNFKIHCLYNNEPSEIRGLTGGTFEVALYVPFKL